MLQRKAFFPAATFKLLFQPQHSDATCKLSIKRSSSCHTRPDISDIYRTSCRVSQHATHRRHLLAQMQNAYSTRLTYMNLIKCFMAIILALWVQGSMSGLLTCCIAVDSKIKSSHQPRLAVSAYSLTWPITMMQGDSFSPCVLLPTVHMVACHTCCWSVPAHLMTATCKA